MKHSISIYILLTFLFYSSFCLAQTETKGDATDSIQLSLLTCAPGEEIYSLFGHTAIRYQNYTQNIDAVFNYGMFSFNTPNFILRFTLGETDYQLGVTSYSEFADEYNYYGRSVWQQNINLTQPEKLKLIKLLEDNYRPENRVYRYNFFFDNCATRPKDQIEKAIDGRLEYGRNMDDKNTGKSFRDIIHQYTKGHPWDRFGIDLCIGSTADRPITYRQMMFAPFYVKDFFEKAIIINPSGVGRPLVEKETKVVNPPNVVTSQQQGLTPLQSSLLLFIIVTLITIYGIRHNKTFWQVDLILFFVAGIIGCILAFLVLFSKHPAVSPNFLLFIFHPIHLLWLPWIIKSGYKKQRSIYMMANCAILTLFTLLWSVIPQRFDLAVLPLALCLLERSASNLIITYKKVK